MAKAGQGDHEGDPKAVGPQCLQIANRGIRTGEDFANMMSAMMSDIIAGRLPPSVANATCNAGGKLLKVVEMQYRYAPPPTGAPQRPSLILAAGEQEGGHES